MNLLYRVKLTLAEIVLRIYASNPERFQRFVERGVQRLIEQLPPGDALRFLFALDEHIQYHLDRQAIRYEGGVLHPKHRLMRYHDFFVDRIHTGETVLDIGCGNGAVAYDVADKSGARVMGMDLNPQHIAIARKHYAHPAVQYLVGDALKELPDERFDVVILSNVLEHIEHRSAFLRQMCATVRPQRILIRVPLFERHWHVPMKKELGLSYFSDDTHYTEYTQESFAQEVQAAGLSLTHLEIRWGEIWAEVAPAVQEMAKQA